MELSELTAYALDKHQIREQHNWADLPGLSVLCHPETGKWIAVLMRQWDSETGTQIERCDLKCGRETLARFPRAYLTLPVRMFGSKWINVIFDGRTENNIVFQLFDQAVEADKPHGYTFVLPGASSVCESAYQETALPFAGSAYRPPMERIPDRLREMRRLYTYGRESDEARAKNFYRQAVFMQDYTDDVPWAGDFTCYFPTYHDLTVRQLRGYFTWRANIRKGIFEPIATSCAYIYVYELLNGIGAVSPEDALAKLRTFETGYIDSGIGDKRMKQNLRRWAFEYAVVHALPTETVLHAADPEMLERDNAFTVLKASGEHSDEEVFSALCVFSDKKITSSPVLSSAPARGMHLFSEAWRAASAYRVEKQNLFTLCFGRKKIRRWHPLANAVVYEQARPKDRTCELDACRSYACRDGVWQVNAYDKLSFDRTRFIGFLRAVDAALRRYLKTGRYLKEDPANAWALPFIEAVIEADKQAQLEASKPRITIDLSGLEKIRRDAEVTRNSLLTEEETESCDIVEEPAAEIAAVQTPLRAPSGPVSAQAFEETPELPLDPVQIQLLRALLSGSDASGIIRSNHLMPSIAADFINEALYDEIGDTVLVCKDDRLSIVEDYIEDLTLLLGENAHG